MGNTSRAAAKPAYPIRRPALFRTNRLGSLRLESKETTTLHRLQTEYAEQRRSSNDRMRTWAMWVSRTVVSRSCGLRDHFSRVDADGSLTAASFETARSTDATPCGDLAEVCFVVACTSNEWETLRDCIGIPRRESSLTTIPPILHFRSRPKARQCPTREGTK